MPADDRQREYRREMLLASTLIAAGLAISVLALTALNARDPQQIAQATPPTQSTPGAETKPPAPPEPGTTGQRPSEVPPQPARPDPDAQKQGAQPALPPAPAEKVAPPIREK
jgi:outer membrane biosynthesis protein TonB